MMKSVYSWSHFFISVVCLLSIVPGPIDAYYCDHDYCNAEQFCCGENICCDYVNNTIWHFICLLISMIVFGFVLWGFIQLIMLMISINCYKQRIEDIEQDNYEANRQPYSVIYIVKRLIGSLRTGQTTNKSPTESAQKFLINSQDNVTHNSHHHYSNVDYS